MKFDVSFNIIIKQKPILLLIRLAQRIIMVTVTVIVTITAIVTLTMTVIVTTTMTTMVTITVLMRLTVQKRHVHKMNQAC